MSNGMGTHPSKHGTSERVSNHRPRHGIQWDNSVREIKILFYHLGFLRTIKNDICLPILLCTLFKVSPFCGATSNPLMRLLAKFPLGIKSQWGPQWLCGSSLTLSLSAQTMINWQVPYSPSPYPNIFSSIVGKSETMPLYPSNCVQTDLAIGLDLFVWHNFFERVSINLLVDSRSVILLSL